MADFFLDVIITEVSQRVTSLLGKANSGLAMSSCTQSVWKERNVSSSGLKSSVNVYLQTLHETIIAATVFGHVAPTGRLAR